MKKGLKVLIASSEMVPYAKTGGLADVAGALPKVLGKMGLDVRAVMPLYKSIDRKEFKLKKTGEHFFVPIAGEMVEVGLWSTKDAESKITTYFIECDRYFDRNEMYQENGVDYPDNDERFALFSRAVIEMLKVAEFKPDIIHCNDWQTGLIPAYLKVLYQDDDFYKNISTVITIHNIAYQGLFHHMTMEKIGLPWEIFNAHGVEFWGHVNYLKAGLVYADVINTVSETYAREIQSSDEFGKGLEGLLKYRSEDVFGILNGIDYEIWNPAADGFIASNFEHKDLRSKNRCKKALQREQELATDNMPMIGLISRLTDQKGFDLIAGALDQIMDMNLQFVVLGTGDPEYHKLLGEMAEKYKGKMSVTLGFDNPLAHKIYAASDIFLMPSLFEPCGLGQMIALRYGSLPLVHKTGGLADTITDFDEDPLLGNGFSFTEYTVDALVDAVKRSLELYSNKRKWNSIVKNCMQQDFSWKKSAEKYTELYEKVMERKMTKV